MVASSTKLRAAFACRICIVPARYAMRMPWCGGERLTEKSLDLFGSAGSDKGLCHCGSGRLRACVSPRDMTFAHTPLTERPA